jgi:hypothetical protein
MLKEVKREVTGLSIYLDLYDFFGYLTPGFIFLFSIYLILNTYYPWALRPLLGLFNMWYGILGIFVTAYVLGHVISWTSKLPERLLGCRNKLPKRFKKHCMMLISEYLFIGEEDSIILFKKKVSENLRDRFAINYYKYILKCEFTSGDWNRRVNEARSFLADLWDNKELRYTDLIWDAALYLLNVAPIQYNKAYSFLSFSGFFRTLWVVWSLLWVFTLVILIGDFNTSLIFVNIIIGFFAVASASRYIKFERMYNYQVIRAFAILDV